VNSVVRSLLHVVVLLFFFFFVPPWFMFSHCVRRLLLSLDSFTIQSFILDSFTFSEGFFLLFSWIGVMGLLGLLDSVLQPVQQALDINRSELYFLINLLLSYPLAYIHREWMKSTFQRHVMSLAVGVLYGVMVFGVESVHFLVTSLFAYFALWLLPRETRLFGVKVQAHVVVYIVCMCYLFVGHIYTTYYHYMEFALNWTASQVNTKEAVFHI
jgi:hypothetical protein